MTVKYRLYLAALFLLALCAGCALLGANVMLGDLNQDEGWYLYAARMVYLGEMPYRDFAYTQAPVLPFIYALAEPLVRAHGLVAGRVFTAVLALGGALIAAALAARLAGRGGRLASAVLALILILVNVYQAYFSAVVKTYALASFLLLAGFLALSVALDARSRLAMFLSAVLFVLAAGTRTSAGIILPIVFLCLCIDSDSRTFLGWLFFGLGALLSGCALVLPFLVAAPQSFWFFVVSYHTLRETGGMWQSLVFKAGFLSRVLAGYFVPVFLWLAIVSAQWFRRFARYPAEQEPARNGKKLLNFILWAGVIAVTLLHILAPFPYDDYQVFIFPVFAVAVAVMAVRFMKPAGPGMAWMLFMVFALCLGTAVSSPINKAWFVQGRDRIWWRLKDQTPLAKLQEAGAMIRSIARPGDLLLTQDPYLAVESGLKLPRGLEMGQFSYFPDFSDETAQKMRVVNRRLLTELIAGRNAPVAALSGYAFAIRSPGITPVAQDEYDALWDEVHGLYDPFLEIPDFGQAFTTLHILKLKSGI